MKIFALIIIIVLSGCSSLKDISNAKPLPFKLKLGVVDLAQDACLFSKSAGSIKQDVDSWLLINTRGEDGCKGSTLLARIPAGNEVELLKLVEHTTYGLFIYTRWYVIGNYKAFDKKVTFYYQLPWYRGNDGNLHKYDTLFLVNGT